MKAAVRKMASLPGLLPGLLLVLLLVAPAVMYPILLAQLLCMALLAAAVNLLLGFGGLLSFGHAAFFGLAGYMAGYCLKEWHFTPEVGLLVGTAGAGLLGLAFGWLAVRRSGIYFSMVTLALAQLVYFVLVQAPFTHGEDGLQGVPRGRLLGLVDLADDNRLYYFVLAVAVGAWLLIRRIVASPFGEVLAAIRDNEVRATSLGYDVRTYKVIAFGLSAALAGLAGALKTLVFGLATLADAHWHVSADAVIMVVLGGVGTLTGPLFGAGVLVLVQYFLAGSYDALVPVVLGFTFMGAVLGFRRGIAGLFSLNRDQKP
jgi:branched-chain amino acid transport system permease protein